MRAAMIEQFLFGCLRPRFQYDKRFADFAPFRIRHADDRTHVNCRMLIQHLFDFDRIHIFAAAEEHVLLAIHDEKIPFLIVLGEVTGMKPTVLVHNRRARFGIIEIAGRV